MITFKSKVFTYQLNHQIKQKSIQINQNRTFISVAQKYLEAYKRFGLKECLWKMYNLGGIKFGKHVGTDKFGNKYYEDETDLAGQNRWCEYRFDHSSFDASQIPAEWHSWLHYTTDAKPGEGPQDPKNWPKRPISQISHAPYTNHLGPQSEFTENLTGFHLRGYKIGSISSGPDEPDRRYFQANHPKIRSHRNLQSRTQFVEDFKDQKPEEIKLLRDLSLK